MPKMNVICSESPANLVIISFMLSKVISDLIVASLIERIGFPLLKLNYSSYLSGPGCVASHPAISLFVSVIYL